MWCVSPSFALACRPSPQQFFARHRRKPGHSEQVVLGQSVAQVVRSRWQSLSPSVQRRNRLTSHSSGRLRRRLIQALGGRAFPFAVLRRRRVFGSVFAKRVVSFWAGLRCRLSRAWSFAVPRARWLISLLRSSRCARFVATWRLSSAVRSSHAGH